MKERVDPVQKLLEMELLDDATYFRWWYALPKEVRRLLSRFKQSRARNCSPEDEKLRRQHIREALAKRTIHSKRLQVERRRRTIANRSPERAVELFKQRSISQKKRFEDPKERHRLGERMRSAHENRPVEEEVERCKKISLAVKKRWAQGKMDGVDFRPKGGVTRNGIKYPTFWDADVGDKLTELGIPFKLQVRLQTSLGSYIADFLLSDSDEYIETKASYFTKGKFEKSDKLQQTKIKELRNRGFIIHRLVDEQIGGWLKKLEGVCEKNFIGQV